MLDRWDKEAFPLLKRCYKERDRDKARPIMIQYTAYCVQMMHWVGGEPVTSLKEKDIIDYINNLSFSPVNIIARL